MANGFLEGNNDVDWESILYSAVGGVVGGVGGSLINIFGVPAGIVGHVVTGYFGDDQTWDILGKGISNGLIGGGLGSFIMTYSASSLGSRAFTTDNLARAGETNLLLSMGQPSLWAYEQLMSGVEQTSQTFSSPSTTTDTEEYLGTIV